MKLIVTFHARQRMDHHGISEEQIKLALQRGAKTPQTDGLVAAYMYISVAYKVRGDKYIIKTVFVNK